jgi:hypothetical protein
MSQDMSKGASMRTGSGADDADLPISEELAAAVDRQSCLTPEQRAWLRGQVAEKRPHKVLLVELGSGADVVDVLGVAARERLECQVFAVDTFARPVLEVLAPEVEPEAEAKDAEASETEAAAGTESEVDAASESEADTETAAAAGAEPEPDAASASESGTAAAAGAEPETEAAAPSEPAEKVFLPAGFLAERAFEEPGLTDVPCTLIHEPQLEEALAEQVHDGIDLLILDGEGLPGERDALLICTPYLASGCTVVFPHRENPLAMTFDRDTLESQLSDASLADRLIEESILERTRLVSFVHARDDDIAFLRKRVKSRNEGLAFFKHRTQSLQEGLDFYKDQAAKRQDGIAFYKRQVESLQQGREFYKGQLEKQQAGVKFYKDRSAKLQEGLDFYKDQAAKRQEGLDFYKDQAAKQQQGLDFYKNQAQKRQEGLDFYKGQLEKQREGVEFYKRQASSREAGWEFYRSRVQAKDREIERYRRQMDHQERQLHNIEHSQTWRIARAIGWLPRKIKKLRK